MASLQLVDLIVELTAVILPPVAVYKNFADINEVVTGVGVSELTHTFLNPASLVSALGDATTNIFTDIWTWILFNMITPLLVIVFIALFFIGQYYLMKLYIWMFKNIGVKIYKLYEKVSSTQKYKEIHNLYIDAFSK